MARRKAPENETVEEQQLRRMKEALANNSNRSEKTSWNRKMDNMVKLMAKLRPIEAEIIKLTNEKIPIIDEVQTLRLVMVNECIHPFEYLTIHEDHAVCKFCEKRLSLPDASTKET